MPRINEILEFVIMAPVSAIIVVAAVLAIIISLERTLGRPIPILRNSLPVKRNRGYFVVLVAMGASFYVVLSAFLTRPICYDGCGYSYAWENPLKLLEVSIMALAFSGGTGWVVFALLSAASASGQIMRRYIVGRPI
jgi:hypothetical protein